MIEFSAERKNVLDFEVEFNEVSFEGSEYLRRAVKSVQESLYKLFFGPIPGAQSSSDKQQDYLVTLIEKLKSESEATLSTFFKVPDLDGEEDDSPFEFNLIDSLAGEGSEAVTDNKFSLVRVWLSNARTIAVLLAKVLFCWLKKLVSTRVVYDRDLFNFEEYSSKCLSDNRLINRTLYATTTSLPNKMPPGKHLMGEFFRFIEQNVEPDPEMRSVCNLSHFIYHLALHIPRIHAGSLQIDTEPILIVYFSSLTRINISKDALSKVSKTFFKELKMHYRRLGPGFTTMLTNLCNFFGGHESQTVASFWQFMIMNVCERIADEHASFVFTILKDRLFTEQAQLKKF